LMRAIQRDVKMPVAIHRTNETIEPDM